MRVFILACLFICIALNAHAADASSGQLMLAQDDVLHGAFTEERHMQGFDGPMNSSGHFVVAPKYGLIWAMEKPFITTTVITPAGLAQSVNGKIVMQLPSQKIPFMLHLYDMLGGALMGNWAPLETDFTVARSGDAQNWQVTLTPHQADNPAMPFSSIQVSGHRYVEKVALIKAGGDTDTLIFIKQSVSQTAPTASEGSSVWCRQTMTRVLATLWLVIVILAGGYLGVRITHGLHFSTDLMALLPQEEQDKARQHSNDITTQALARRVVLMVGDKDKTVARQVATNMTRQLVASGLFDMTTDNFDKSQLQQLGSLYYPYRAGLLSDKDRALLKSGDGQTIARRALSQVYGVVGFANAKLLHGDPFLLLPSFLTSLPLPQSRLTLDDGMLSLQDNGTTWILVAGQLKGEPFALETQKQVAVVYDSAVKAQRELHPDSQILHLGAVFFAKAGAEQAMGETSTIGIASTLGTILLIIVMFRAVRPLLLSLLVIGVGILTALSTNPIVVWRTPCRCPAIRYQPDRCFG